MKAETVGDANTDRNESVPLSGAAGLRPEERVASLGFDLRYRKPETRDPYRIEIHPQLRIVSLHSVEEIHEPRDRRDRGSDTLGCGFGGEMVGAEQFELDGRRGAREIADHVLQELDDLDAYGRGPRLRLRAY